MANLPIVTTSSRTCFRRCPQRWWWTYVDGWRKRGEFADALWFGIGVHEALAQWYQLGTERGEYPADYFERWHGEEERFISAEYTDHDRDREAGEAVRYENALELGVSMLEGYIEEYGDDSDWDVIDIEHKFKIKVFYHGVHIAYFLSTWDGIYRDEDDGQVYLMEHKTASQIQLPYLELDDQAGVYWAFAQPVLRKQGVLAEDEEIAGITYNFLRKSKGDDRPTDENGRSLNKDGSVSKRQPVRRYVRELVERSPKERRTQLKRLSDEVFIMTGMMEGTIPVTKSTSKDCTFCEFFTVCKSHERGGSAWKEVMRAEFSRADPFDRYLKSASV